MYKKKTKYYLFNYLRTTYIHRELEKLLIYLTVDLPKTTISNSQFFEIKHTLINSFLISIIFKVIRLLKLEDYGTIILKLLRNECRG